MRTSKLLLLFSACPLAVIAAAPAMAQDSPRAQDAAAVEEASAVGDIIVTARKRDERLQDVPVAISAFTAEDLNRYATGSVTDVANQTPQLIIGGATGPAGSAINLRGVGANATTPSVDQSVSVNIDGIQVSQANSLQLGIYDLERVEVLKGPQALFFGKNSPGGVISLTSADPGKELEWRVRSGYEFKAERKFLEAMVSAPLTDTLGVRLIGNVSDQNGWFRNLARPIPGGQGASVHSAMKQKEYFVRGTLRYQSPDDFFDAKLKLSFGKQDRDNGLVVGSQLFACPMGVPQGSFGLPGAVTDCKIDRNALESDFSAAATATDPDFYRDGRPYYENEQILASLTANIRPADGLTVTSVTGYLDTKERWTSNFSDGERERLLTGADTRQKQFTQELRLASDFETPLNFMVGAYYQHAKLYLAIPVTFGSVIAQNILGPGAPPVLAADEFFTQKTNAYSVFGQLIWDITPELELSGGARYSHEKKTESGYRAPSLFSGFNTVPFNFSDPSVSFNNFSPEATLTYKPASNLTFYAAYRRGFTSGGFNLVPLAFGLGPVDTNNFKQATVRGGELGAKGSLADRQISFDLTVYNYKYSNLQLSAFDPATVALSVKNAGSARVKGVEFTLGLSPRQIKGLNLRGSVAYNHGRYIDYRNAGCYQGQTIALGCTGNLATTNGVTAFTTQDLSGAPLERAPDWSLNFGGTYDHLLSNGMTLSLSADESYSSSYFSQPEHDARSIQKGAWRLNAGLALRGQDDGWEVALIGKNLTNKLRAVSSFSMPFTGFGTGTAGPALGSDLLGSVSEPRSILLQLTIRNTLFP